MSVAVVSVHDVAPATHHESAHLLGHVEGLGARASLLVVPGPWQGRYLGDDVGFVEWLRAAEQRGHEIVAHGWEHRAVDDVTVRPDLARRLGERVLTRGCAEFSALGKAEAERRAALARASLRACGFAPDGFVAPGWSLSSAATEALRTLGFGYTTTRFAVTDLHRSTSVTVPAVCHRADSPVAAIAARMLVTAVTMRCRGRRCIRLALHPRDVHDDRLDRATRRALAVLASSDLELITYADLVDRRRA